MINRLGFVPVPAKILVVDDHESVRDLLRLLLEGEGYQVIEASDGAEALNYIDKEHPDLLILDLMMPEVDGEQVIKTMWRSQESVKTPVVVVSAKYEALEELTELIGRVNVFPKPFEPTKLLDRVRELCG
jgi:two-component system, OmpR family, alkaline phosphatase synthesis response regulator PhoP